MKYSVLMSIKPYNLMKDVKSVFSHLLRSLRELLDAELFIKVSPDQKAAYSGSEPDEGIWDAERENLLNLLRAAAVGAVRADWCCHGGGWWRGKPPFTGAVENNTVTEKQTS